MELNYWLLAIVIVILIVTRFIPVKGITNITPTEAKEKFKQKNVQFIDVRTPGEYTRNHQLPFRNIPLYELTQRVNELNKTKDVVVICQSGIRSSKAARVLKKHGFNQIFNVKGGMSAWKRMNMPNN
ncbi:rhodanese-like domain-containing protein [Ornithinibacillus bavariensis]|uniref:Sulfurtransferase n=1 Tax=Ornithinibacillus bavariensis TaxID=545502 RepID=A0A919X9U5_9BACI|nr:rhodanese-like domain-containing protein [Ornithinibacillus bavariensis]GIO28701.1 sulfurtransferase [Ornithinibacillus bavariensis]